MRAEFLITRHDQYFQHPGSGLPIVKLVSHEVRVFNLHEIIFSIAVGYIWPALVE